MNKICLLVFVFSLVLGAYLPTKAQQLSTVDSLTQAFYTVKNDSIRWEITQELCFAYNYIQTDSVMKWARVSLELAQKLEDSNRLGKSRFRLGLAYAYKNEFSAAMEEYLKAVTWYEETNNQQGLNETKVEIAMINLKTEEFEKVKPYLNEAYHYFRSRNDTFNILYTIGSYQQYFEKIENFDSLLFYSHEALEASQRYGRLQNEKITYSNLAATYLHLNDLANAKKYLQKRGQLGFEGDDRGAYFHSWILSEYHKQAGQPDSAAYFARQGIDQARVFGDLQLEIEMYALLANIFEQKKEYEKAFTYLDLQRKYQDSLNRIQFQEDLSEMTIQYETQQKEAQIAQQQLLLQKESNRKNLYLAGGIVLFLFGIGLLLYFRYRLQMRQKQAQMDLQLKEAEASQLRDMDKLKSNFFANISHEFRTPLTLILNPLKQLAQGTYQGDPSKAYQLMTRNGERLLRLVNQLLELARLESGHAESRLEPVDLVKVVKAIVYAFESWPLRKQIYFQTQFPSASIAVEADIDKLEKILSNLLTNAFKFTPEKGRVIFQMKSLESTPESAKVEFLVQDSGPGIAPDYLPHIFDRFYSRGFNEPDAYSSGIGLSLTKELVEWQNGTIEVESTLEKGSTFRVILPFTSVGVERVGQSEVSMVKPEAVPEIESDSTAKGPKGRKPQVLVVEDNPDLREYIREQLNHQFQVVEARNGKTGLEQAFETIPDLIISDVMMPEIDGLEVCQRIKQDERTSHVPVILLTALADQAERLEGITSGADAYLTKPFNTEELQLTAQNLIDQRRILQKKFAEGISLLSDTTSNYSSTEAAFLQRVEQVVLDNLDNAEFTIEEMGKIIGMSRSQLHRKLRALTDHSPSAFVRSIRLQEAFKLLEQKEGNITEVAFRVGIPNLPYFSRSFHEQFGFPPSELLYQ